MTVEIRQIGEDCTDLIALRRQWFPEPDPDLDRRLRTWWERERHQRHALVAYADEAPIGMANAQIFSRMPTPGHPDTQWLYVANVFVVDEHRQRGVGRGLMQALLDFARGNGMAKVVLAPSEMSIPLYTSVGFRVADDLMRLDM